MTLFLSVCQPQPEAFQDCPGPSRSMPSLEAETCPPVATWAIRLSLLVAQKQVEICNCRTGANLLQKIQPSLGVYPHLPWSPREPRS